MSCFFPLLWGLVSVVANISVSVSAELGDGGDGLGAVHSHTAASEFSLWQPTPGMSVWFHKGSIVCRFFLPTNQAQTVWPISCLKTEIGSLNDLSLVGCCWVGTKACSNSALCGTVWTSLSSIVSSEWRVCSWYFSIWITPVFVLFLPVILEIFCLLRP